MLTYVSGESATSIFRVQNVACKKSECYLETDTVKSPYEFCMTDVITRSSGFLQKLINEELLERKVAAPV
jgi:hypothetical protein